MADTVLNQEGTTAPKALFYDENSRKVITHFNVVSDSTGSKTEIIDVSDYSDAHGNTAATANLNKVWYSVSVTAKVDALRLVWDADTDATFLTLEGDGFLDYSSIGGLKNNLATNYTGNVKAVLPACTSGDSATVTCEWILNY